MKPSSLRNQTGSTSIEAAVALLSLTAIVTATFFVSYLAFVSVWVDREGYEALVCLGSLGKTYECESDLRKGIDAAIPIGQLSSVNLTRSSSSASVHLQLRIHKHQIFDWQKTQGLPLKPSQSFR